ncbi:hypothetical protein BX616_007679, partial [Lobosporangium transversale]
TAVVPPTDAPISSPNKLKERSTTALSTSVKPSVKITKNTTTADADKQSKENKDKVKDNRVDADTSPDDEKKNDLIVPLKKRRITKERKQQQELDIESDVKSRCTWAANTKYPLLQQYHDTEWCIPGGFNRTNRYLFEMLILEGAQAGLSWATVLHKREAYRKAYDNFDYNVIADTYTSPESNERLLKTDIIKNKLKVEASIVNARAFKRLLQELYPDQAQPEDENGFWQFLQAYKYRPKGQERAKSTSHHLEKDIIVKNEESDRLSADLKKLGFKFVGSTIMYAFLQAIGMEVEGVHHSRDCFMNPNNM